MEALGIYPGIVLVLFGSLMMFYNNAVAVKMLPFDNKNEFEIVIDMPEGTTLEKTLVVANEIAGYVSMQPRLRITRYMREQQRLPALMDWFVIMIYVVEIMLQRCR